MPLPDILKRRVKATPEKAQPQPQIAPKRPQKLPLEGFNASGFQIQPPKHEISRLVTCLDDILEENVALGYFMQYLDAKNENSLMKFWLDVSSFKAASLVKNDIISPGCDSLDSGITSDLSSASKVSNLSSLTEDAVQIYQRYVSPDCPYPIDLSLEQKQSIVRGICTEDGQVDGGCFDETKDYVHDVLDSQFFADFLRSPFYAKHQLEVFACDGGVTIQGILSHDVLLFHFMEFMENEGKSERALVEFWMTAKNFSQNISDQSSRQSDAMLIYEKFFSLQASNPLGFSCQIRSKVEEAICTPDGSVRNDCFDEAINIVEVLMQKSYLKPFLSSSLFSKYFTGLTMTIEKAGVASAVSTASVQRQRSASGSSMNTTCSSETLSSTTHNISTRNTLLASSTSSRKKRRRSPDFLDKSNEPDFLWRRKQSVLTNIGHVDHLGRYISCLDLPPDTTQKRQVLIEPNMKARISKAVRKIITNDDMERLKEEMAWQMAELVISDVINRSKFPPVSDEEALSTLGLPSTPSKLSTSLRKVSSTSNP